MKPDVGNASARPVHRNSAFPLLAKILALAVGLNLNLFSSQAADVTYNAVERWSVTLEYEDFADGVTKSVTSTGTATGKITVRNDSYTLLNKSGVQLGGIDADIITRYIYPSGNNYSISGDYVFAPAYGANARGILFLGAFIVSVPFIDGEVPAFYDFEYYSGFGPSSGIAGGGFMQGVSLTVTVSSTLALTPGSGPTPSDNPFAPAAGNYAGLIVNPEDIQPETSGFLTAKVNSSGTFSAKVTTGGGSAGISGRFDLNGKATNQIVIGAETLMAELSLDLGEGGKLTGLLRSSNWDATLETYRAAFDSKTHPATDLAYRYTLLIPGTANPALDTEPAGDGYAAVSVTTAGLASLKGALADGTPITHRAALSQGGGWPIYIKLKGGAGALMGWLQVDPSSENAIEGSLLWLKSPGTKSRYYQNGFAFHTTALGSIWWPLDANDGFGTGSLFISLTGGNLPAPLDYDITFSEQGKLIYSGPDKMSFKMSPSTGLFSGTIQPASTGSKIRFQGAVLLHEQAPAYGAGFFLGTNQSGRFLIE
jgi:hypothetical protein